MTGMASHHQIIAEFEEAGETEVQRRVAANVYDGEHLAHALYWLNELSVARTFGPKPPQDPEAERRAAYRQIDTLIRAAAAATVAVALIGLALVAYQSIARANAVHPPPSRAAAASHLG
ncbi:MAG TPA: hypothetical protein VF459_13215 [Caulobacteraceae bacterium]